VRRTIALVSCSMLYVLATAPALFAQAAPPAPPAPPPGAWTQTASAGIALTSGNKDTSTLNLGYEFKYDPKTRNLVRSDGLLLHGKTDGEVTSDRLGLNGRDEYKLHDGLYAFGQLQYLRDPFKDIEYLIAPTGGLGYRVVDTARTKLSVDGGLGGVWEARPGGDADHSGAVVYGEKLNHQLTTTTVLTQSFSALYKTADFSDAIYAFNATAAVTVASHMQLKVEVLDTYKNLVVAPTQKNDVALIVGLVYKR
jgi:putative salt-induced outer membrane protein YdiY